MRHIAWAAIIGTCLSCSALAEVKPAAVFGNHMVLQRGMPVPVWGTAAAGEEVTVEFAGQTKTVTADKDGNWRVTLDPMKASTEPRAMTITSTTNHEPLTISGVLVGEVWLGSGQSNMQWDLCRVSTKEARPLCDNPLIRYRTNISKDYSQGQAAKRCPGAEPVERHTWYVMSPATFYNCSANMFFFAAKLQKELGVPVGVIVEAMGATSTRHWTPADTFNNNAACLADLEASKQLLAAFARQPFRMPTNKDYTPKPFSVKDDDLMAAWAKGGAGYNGIKALQPYALRGVCWDQGEHGSGASGLSLVPATVAMVGAWRRDWGRKPSELPFIQSQKPSGFGDPGLQRKGKPRDLPAAGAPMLDLGVERQENWRVQELAPYVFTANSMDPAMAGYHPNRKDLYGYRYADWALAAFYGRPAPHQTPVVKTCEFADGKALLTFKEVGDGLKAIDGEPLRGFFIAAADRVYFPAQAEIAGKDQVRVRADEVKEPALVMYGVMQGLGNLASGDNLLAFPYRSEPWAMPDPKAVEARVWPILEKSEPGPIQEAAAQVLWQMALREADTVDLLKGALDKSLAAGKLDHSVALMVLLGRHAQTGDEKVKQAAKDAFQAGLEKGKDLKNFTFLASKTMKYKVADATIKELMGK